MSTDDSSDSKPETFTGHDVVGPDGESIGKVTDVIYEEVANTPEWMVVDPGILQAEHYVPVEGSHATEDGRIEVPFDKKQVKSAPKATGAHVVDEQLQQDLTEHYGDSPT